MRPFLKAILFSLTFLFVTGALLVYFLLGRIAHSPDFKRFAEKRAGEYLKATVHIGEIRPHHLNQLALEKILIETPSAKGGSQLVRVDRLLFRYSLKQLWSRKFDAPAGVVLNNPAILIEQDQFPYRYFENAPGRSSGFSMPSLDFRGGEIRYLLSSLGKEILLREVEGKIFPSLDKKVRVDVRARVTGIVDGRVHIYGTVDPSKNTHDLWLELDAMDLAPDIPLPFKALKGRVHWVGHDLFFDGLQGTLYGWHAELSGVFLNREGQPEMNAHVRIGKGVPWMKLDFDLSLSHQTIEGTFQSMEGQIFDFNGKVHQDRKLFVVDSLVLSSGYRGRGELDFASGTAGGGYALGSGSQFTEDGKILANDDITTDTGLYAEYLEINELAGNGILVTATGTQDGIHIDKTGAGQGIEIDHSGMGGIGLLVKKTEITDTGHALEIVNWGVGKALFIRNDDLYGDDVSMDVTNSDTSSSADEVLFSQSGQGTILTLDNNDSDHAALSFKVLNKGNQPVVFITHDGTIWASEALHVGGQLFASGATFASGTYDTVYANYIEVAADGMEVIL